MDNSVWGDRGCCFNESAAHEANSLNGKNNTSSDGSHIKGDLARTPDVIRFNEEKQEGAGFTQTY